MVDGEREKTLRRKMRTLKEKYMEEEDRRTGLREVIIVLFLSLLKTSILPVFGVTEEGRAG